MNLTSQQYASVYGAAEYELVRSWAVRDPAKRKWLALVVAEEINYGPSATYGLAEHDQSYRAAFIEQVKLRIRARNERDGGKYGFVIWPILLAAVLSWLIQKLLDDLFTGDNAMAEVIRGNPPGELGPWEKLKLLDWKALLWAVVAAALAWASVHLVPFLEGYGGWVTMAWQLVGPMVRLAILKWSNNTQEKLPAN